MNSPTAVRDDFLEMRAAAEQDSHVVRDGTDVSSRGAFDGDPRARAFHIFDAKFVHLDFDGFQFDGFIFAREFVGGFAVDFLGGIRRRHLRETAGQFRGKSFQFSRVETAGDESGPAGVPSAS